MGLCNVILESNSPKLVKVLNNPLFTQKKIVIGVNQLDGSQTIRKAQHDRARDNTEPRLISYSFSFFY